MPINLNELNKNQRKAVQQIEGPVIILAGAGSGKTRTMTYRIAYMIEQGIKPYNILAVTFTNKAAKEMKERALKLIGENCAPPTMCTFHSLGVLIMRQAGTRLGYRKNIQICDADDSQKRIKNIMKQQNLDKGLYPTIAEYISKSKDALKDPDECINEINKILNEIQSRQEIQNTAANADPATVETLNQEMILARIYETYQNELFADNMVDFDDLIMKPVKIFKANPDVLEYYQNKFRYIMVDEYQDTSHAQFELIRLLAEKYRNICVVGDDYQSIYAFRGADIKNILSFNDQYPEAFTVKIGENYRSTQTIVNAAAELIKHNPHQMDKTLVSMQEMGDPIVLYKAIGEQQEADFVAKTISKYILQGAKPADFAVLYRKNAFSRSIEDALLRVNIPYRIFGGISFYQRAEVKDMIAYLKLLNADQSNDRLAFERVINVPKRGIGKAKIEMITKIALENGTSELAVAMAEPKLDKIAGIVEFRDTISTLKSEMAELELPDLIMRITDMIKYHDYLDSIQQKNAEGNKSDKWDNVNELANKAREYTDMHADTPKEQLLSDFLAEITLLTDQDTAKDANMVSLMSMHRSKGLEFPYVFVIGCEEQCFPHDSFVIGGKESQDVQEDRRLCYVAMTRAKKELFMSYAESRYVYGEYKSREMSRYLNEIPKEYVEKNF